jgi:hypothetical protein
MWVVYDMQCSYCAHRWIAVKEYVQGAQGVECPHCGILDADRRWPEPDDQTKDMRQKPVPAA